MVTHRRQAKVTNPQRLGPATGPAAGPAAGPVPGPTPGRSAPLRRLAALYGVEMEYRGAKGVKVGSPAESVAAVLRCLGAELPGALGTVPPDTALARAVRRRRKELAARMVEPVLVAWDGLLPSVVLRPPRAAGAAPRLTLTTEEGEVREWRVPLEEMSQIHPIIRESDDGVAVEIPTPFGAARRLPYGYHQLRVEWGRHSAVANVIAAPHRCVPARLPGEAGGRWGIFSPLYALRSGRDWGAGDLAELRALSQWTAEQGGSAVATLPLLASFLRLPFEPSPYRPVSRLFWNEFYLPVELLPEWETCSEARERLNYPEMSTWLAELRRGDLVDYRGVMALKRSVLEVMARAFFETGDESRKRRFASWLAANPVALDYAAFRARVEEQRNDWRAWTCTEAGLGGGGEAGPWPASPDERYHLYCQWHMEEQLAALADDGGEATAGLLLDVPVGVHPGGFDTWRWPHLFAHDASLGAPPDAFFALGQQWDSPPLHPERCREEGHRYFAASVRQHMRFASFVRIDHVMSLHRLFWIPAGADPDAGVYVSYPAEELYAVLSLESHRNQAVVVGEDLGTVPSGVRQAMRRHGVLRTWVAQTSFRPRSADPVATVPPGCVASINTHDMFPFAGFVAGADIEARLKTRQVEEAGARREAAARARLVARLHHWAGKQAAGSASVPGQYSAIPQEKTAAPATNAGPPLTPAAHPLLRPLFSHLLNSDATLTLANLEDLLGETRPQNVPGTGDDWANWRRKLRVG